MSKYRVIIHDWDDTITASISSYKLLFTDFAEYFKLKKPDEDLLNKHWGKSVGEIAAGAIPNLELSDAIEKMDVFMTEFGTKPYETDIKLLPKVKETIKKLYESEKILGIVSNGKRNRITRNYKNLIDKEMKYHHFIHGYEETEYRKPDPRVFQNSMDFIETNYGLGKDTVVYIGNSVRDYIAARDFEIGFFAVTSGVVKKERFMEEGLEEEYIMGSFSNILKKL